MRPRAEVAALLARLFALEAPQVALRQDAYSLNSLNGFARERRAALVLQVSPRGGRGVPRRVLQRGPLGRSRPASGSAGGSFAPGGRAGAALPPGGRSALCRPLPRRELAPGEAPPPATTAAPALRPGPLLAAAETLDAAAGAVLADSLHAITPKQSAAEPIHRLFSARLGEAGEGGPRRARRLVLWRAVLRTSERGGGRGGGGGRRCRACVGGALPPLLAHQRAGLPPSPFSLASPRAARLLAPESLARFGGALAPRRRPRRQPLRRAPSLRCPRHGGARCAGRSRPPAGACATLTRPSPGAHVPALLAEAKATFHNVFAHPFWLYEPGLAERTFKVSARRQGDELVVEHDWALTPLRAGLLESKLRHIWRPLLAAMAEAGLLAPGWQSALAAALFCCPTLVLPLRAGAAGGLGAPQTPGLLPPRLGACGGSGRLGGAGPRRTRHLPPSPPSSSPSAKTTARQRTADLPAAPSAPSGGGAHGVLNPVRDLSARRRRASVIPAVSPRRHKSPLLGARWASSSSSAAASASSSPAKKPWLTSLGARRRTIPRHVPERELGVILHRPAGPVGVADLQRLVGAVGGFRRASRNRGGACRVRPRGWRWRQRSAACLRRGGGRGARRCCAPPEPRSR